MGATELADGLVCSISSH
jgi:hypothetical protein